MPTEIKTANLAAKIYEREKLKWRKCIYGNEGKYKIEVSEFRHHWSFICEGENSQQFEGSLIAKEDLGVVGGRGYEKIIVNMVAVNICLAM